MSTLEEVTKAMKRIDSIHRIVIDCQAAKIDGVLVDLQSAKLFLRSYQTTKSAQVKTAMETLPIEKVIGTLWKCVK